METKQKKQMDLLTAIEQIVEKAKDSKLSPEFYRKASRYIKYVSDKLGLTKEQSVMLALFINRSDDSSIRISDLSEDVKCSTIHILRYMNDIDVLERGNSSVVAETLIVIERVSLTEYHSTSLKP